MNLERGSFLITVNCLSLVCSGCYMSTGASFMMDAEHDRPEMDPGEDGADPVCGNGLVEAGEECDDGNTLPLDGCDADCRIEHCIPSTEICNGEDDDCDGLIDEDGVCGCLDPHDLTVLHMETVAGPGDAADPSIAWNGSEYGVVWTEGFARVNRGGRVIEARSSYGLMGSSAADVFWSETIGRFVFCWSSMADVICGTQDPGSSPQQRYTVIDTGMSGIGYNNPRTAWNPGREEFAVFHPILGTYANQTYAVDRINPAFEVVGESAVANDNYALSIYYSALTWTGEMYAFIYAAADNGIYLSRFSDRGEKLGSDVLVDRFEEFEYLSRTLLWDGAAFGAAVSDFHNLFFLRFDAEGVLQSRVQVTDYMMGELVYMPVLAAGPWDAMVWYDAVGNHQVWFNVVDGDGRPLRDPILVSAQGIYPWVATDQDTYLVAWREGDIWNPEIGFARIGCP